MEYAVVLQGQLPGAKVPPDVGVSQRTHGHGEQAECEDADAHMPSLWELDHSSDKGQRDCSAYPLRYPQRMSDFSEREMF